jgi:hypothetical protein
MKKIFDYIKYNINCASRFYSVRLFLYFLLNAMCCMILGVFIKLLIEGASISYWYTIGPGLAIFYYVKMCFKFENKIYTKFNV